LYRNLNNRVLKFQDIRIKVFNKYAPLTEDIKFDLHIQDKLQFIKRLIMPTEDILHVKLIRNYHLIGYLRKFLMVFLVFCFQDIPVAALISLIII
jgi:hypothetical protein